MSGRYGTFYSAVDARPVTVNALDVDGVKTAAATPVAAVVYSAANLNGAVMSGVTGQFAGGLPRAVSVTTTVNAGTYVVATPIIVTGVEWRTGKSVQQTLTLTLANGGETINGSVMFSDAFPITVSVPAQVDAGGTFAFGVTIATAIRPPAHALHIRTAGILFARLSRQPHTVLPQQLVGAEGDNPYEVAEIQVGTTATGLVALYGTPIV